MSAAHKDKCPVAAGQIVKSLSNRTTDFIAAAFRIATADAGLTLLGVALLIQAVLVALGVLQ